MHDTDDHIIITEVQQSCKSEGSNAVIYRSMLHLMEISSSTSSSTNISVTTTAARNADEASATASRPRRHNGMTAAGPAATARATDVDCPTQAAVAASQKIAARRHNQATGSNPDTLTPANNTAGGNRDQERANRDRDARAAARRNRS